MNVDVEVRLTWCAFAPCYYYYMAALISLTERKLTEVRPDGTPKYFPTAVSPPVTILAAISTRCSNAMDRALMDADL
jgi:hypothetical protein